MVRALGALALALLLACDQAAPDSPQPAAISVMPARAELAALEEIVRLTAAVRDQNGQPMPSAPVTWTSTGSTVATVDGSGLVTAAANGVATITATAGMVSAMATVTVTQAVATVAVTPPIATVVEADTLRLSAVAADANGHEVSGALITWASADTLVAMVNALGLVRGVNAGVVVVEGSTASGVTGRTEIEVVPPVPAAVAVSPDTVVLGALGATATLTAKVSDQAARVMEGAAVSWTSGDTAVAVVDSAGVVTAVAGGATAITAMAGAASGSAVVTVAQVVGSVAVTPAADTVELGDTLRLSAEAFDGNGHRVAGARFEWRSSDTAVARVDQTGLVTGAGEGTAAITAAAADANAAAEIAVVNPDRAALVAFYEATDGWGVQARGWATDAPLGDWNGVTVNSVGRVVELSFGYLPIAGSIPPQLADLTYLRTLSLGNTRLTGKIPPELGDLPRLEALHFESSGGGGGGTGQPPKKDLGGRIPPELGRLANLRFLDLRGGFVGPIPPELGNLPKLEGLSLFGLRLFGPVPPSLQSLPNLSALDLRSRCRLYVNDTSVCAPFEALCAPSEAMLAWLRGRHRIEYIPRCGAGAAHLIQATQSQEQPVPLIADRPAALQLFDVDATDAQAHFYLGGGQVHSMKVDQALVPGSVMRPGLEMVVEGKGWRIPETGRQSIDVREVALFSLTLIPFVARDTSETHKVTAAARDMAADPEGHPLLSYATALLPASDWSVTQHEPVWIDKDNYSGINTSELATRTRAIRLLENGAGYWMGLLPYGGGALGRAYVGGWASVAVPDAQVIAHELGHNLGLRHTPGTRGSYNDPEYPYLDHMIGAWGLAIRDVCAWHQGHRDFWCTFDAGALISPSTPDVMSYNRDVWISDYHFEKALAHRLRVEASSVAALRAAPTRTLLLWGGESESGGLHLDPAFVVDAMPVLPDSTGGYTLTGRDADSRELFSVAFAMPEIADGDEAAGGFVYTLPVQPGWEALASVTLTAPDGRTATLDTLTDRRMTILRDSRTGRVRAFLDGVSAAVFQADGGSEDLAVKLGAVAITSAGIPPKDAWRR